MINFINKFIIKFKDKKLNKTRSKLNRKIIFYLNDVKDNEIIVSHDETRKAINKVSKNKLKNVIIKTYSIADINFDLSDPAWGYYFDIYLCKLYEGENKPRYLKIYPHMNSISKDLKYCNDLRRLVLGGTFDIALKNSNEVVE